MRTLYLDCFSGISGDMFVGAMLDLGVGFEALQEELAKLRLRDYRLVASRVDRSGISATKFDCIVEAHHHNQHHHSHRPLSEIEQMIATSTLNSTVKDRATSIFRKLGLAESRIHNVPVENIHFHEVGAVDSIVDIVGASICLDLLGVDRIVSSPLKVGTGTFTCAHGVYPVPGPATAELLKGIPAYAGEVDGELVTPTGAAIVATLASGFGSLPVLTIDGVGYGAGSRDTPRSPNVLRAIVGKEDDSSEADSVAVIETNIDDLTPQVYGHLMERLFAAGALDVFFTPVQMKKNRPGMLVTVITRPSDRERISAVLFNETTTLGIRYRIERREVLRREHRLVDTRFGKIRIKLGFSGDGTLSSYTPEFEDCRDAAIRAAAPFHQVQAEAIRAFLSTQSEKE
jgi:uncharacterized protein (TIGR00299 family) protein